MNPLFDKTSKCIRCGFCLEACPTFVLTGKETESPRGRIYLVRSALEGELNWNEDVQEHLDTCLGCRACETACPSGVEYGSILEMARSKLFAEKVRPLKERFARKLLLNTITNPNKLNLSIRLGSGLASLLTGNLTEESQETRMPKTETGDWPKGDYPNPSRRVYFLQGCAMKSLYSVTNAATIHLLRKHGCEVLIPKNAKCCGALHMHSGDESRARELALALIEQMPDDIPIITNSAGCGSAMKEYVTHISTDAAKRFSKNTLDITEFLSEIGFQPTARTEAKVTYHDACHLAHGQKIRSQPRELIKATPGVTLIELEDADRCCGSAGIYNLTQPKLARTLLTQKWEQIKKTGVDAVVTGNPGCLAWIQQAADEENSKIRVVHTARFLAGG